MKENSASIVAQLFPDHATAEQDDAPSLEGGQRVPHIRRPPVERWRVAEWGDEAVGRHNGGVNGEEGMDRASGRGRRGPLQDTPRGESRLEGFVLELGAGSLSKTR